MNTNHSQPRIEELDYLKGILILLVISFHLVYIGQSYPYLKQWVYTFHMPGFLLLSGYLMNIGKPKVDFLKTILWLGVPYLLLESGYTLMASLLPIHDHINHLTPMVFIDKLLVHPLGPYWYLHTLILCGCVYYIIGNCTENKRLLKFSLMVVSCYGLSLLGFMDFSCACYFLTGALIKQYGYLFTDVFKGSWIALIVLVLLSTDASLFHKASVYGIMIVYCAMSSMLLILRFLPQRLRQGTCFLGRNSLLLYLFSPVFTILCKYLQPFLAFDRSALLFWMASLVICVCGSLLIGKALDLLNLSPFIFGKRKVVTM